MRIVKGFFTFLFAVSLIFTSFPVYASENKYEGVEVSVRQGDIDFAKVKEVGKDIVYIRAGYGISEDSNFREYAISAKEADLKIGFYFYVTALNVTEAQKQAKHFISLIDDYSFDCVPAVVFEQISGLTKEETNDIAIAFNETLAEYTNIMPLFYSSSYRTGSLWEDTLTRFPLWVTNHKAGDAPKTGIWQNWAGYQYSSKGEVSGISGNVDLDYFTKDVFVDKSSLVDKNDLPFVDMQLDDWYYNAVYNLYSEHLIAGVSSTEFAPKEEVDWDTIVTILYRLEGQPTGIDDINFKAVADGEWYSDGMIWAVQNKIAMVNDDNHCSPEQRITREEMCEILYRYAIYKGYDVTLGEGCVISKFEDAKEVNKSKEEALKWSVDWGIIKGTSATTLSPKEIVTRGQMTVILDRFLD